VVHVGAPACAVGVDDVAAGVGLPSMVGEATEGVLGAVEVLGVDAELDAVLWGEGPELPVQPVTTAIETRAQTGARVRTHRA